jgi:tRNA (guanine-N(7)-)-methyltransferase subunit TRM82
MPKRPCSIAVTSDNQAILSADKFGDVYSIPLIPSPSNSTTPAAASRSATPSTPQAFKPQANEFTVHTKRNLKALENQKLGLKIKAADKPAEPAFEHTLLLGHVSMLTAVAVGTHPTTHRSYILTADRDEHIRVSRGEPSQAHIIDAFCLGHEDFVSRLCIPPLSPEILVSGGGDDDIFVWNWAEGRLLARASVLEQVQKVTPKATKVAVSQLFAYSEEGGATTIFVICER